MNSFKNTLSFAKEMDANDSLKSFRDMFHFPTLNNSKEVLYFTGNSLGLQPKSAKKEINKQMEQWEKYAVEGHFKGDTPFVNYQDLFTPYLSEIIGAESSEVVVMNTLSVNLNLMLFSFYKPTKSKFKIICEKNAFPSDQYAFHMIAKHYGLNPKEVIIEVQAKEGATTLTKKDIENCMNEHKESTALVLFGGVNYLTGQAYDIEFITTKAHKIGAIAGFDLAHAAGNIKLSLSKWKVDFACWCSYKYMNGGPGGVSGVFINKKHGKDKTIIRMAGWWGHNKEERFLMAKQFDPIPNAKGWQLSCPPILNMASYLASLKIFKKAGMKRLIAKSELLTSYLEFILEEYNIYLNRKKSEKSITIITPKEKNNRGAQLSIIANNFDKSLFDFLIQNNAIVDWRQPNIIRVAPVPLYNSFEDVFKLGVLLKLFLKE